MSAEDIEYMGDYKEFPTKESALDWLDNYLSLDERNNLIRALEQEPCEDAINRQSVLDLFNKSDEYSWEMGLLRKKIEQLQPVTPQPKIGRWINDKCSACGKGIEDLIDSYEWYRNEKPNFCPFCGLRLVDSQESEKLKGEQK